MSGRRYELRTDARTGERWLAVAVRGEELKNDPLLNKGTCFTREEREAFGLVGHLPPAVSTPAQQAARAYDNYQKAGDDIRRYLFLAALQDRNETLFYRLLTDHLEEMAPVVYTPTVGKVCEEYSHIYRRPRGIYVSSLERGRITEVLRGSGHHDARILVITDNEAILGLGDQGVGGMGIPIGKLALYTAGAGIEPAAGLPIDFDVGTDNEALLADPLYLGVRHRRLRGTDYWSLLDELVAAIAEVFPRAIVQWEDFANENAFAILDRYRTQIPSFNDDVQGTGAVVAAGVRTAVHRIGRDLAGERVVFHGAGASGGGSAIAVRAALREAGVPETELARRVLLLDSKGLIVRDRPGLGGHKLRLAADPALVSDWPRPAGGTHSLEEVVRHFRPTALVGCSGRPGAFTEAIVRCMHAHCPRPIVLALSNPTRMAEATPADVLRWTNGAAIVGTGSPFPPVVHGGETFHIGQGNNALVFPGVGLGAMAVAARWIPDEAFLAASRAVFEASLPASGPGEPLFPSIVRLREVSRRVAEAVGVALVEHGAAPNARRETIRERIDALVWEPVYRPYRPPN